MQSQSKINLSWKSRQLCYSCILSKNKRSIFLDQIVSLKKLCDHNECGCWIFNSMLERYQGYRTLCRMLAAAWFNQFFHLPINLVYISFFLWPFAFGLLIFIPIFCLAQLPSPRSNSIKFFRSLFAMSISILKTFRAASTPYIFTE